MCRWPPARAHLKQPSVSVPTGNSVTGGKVTGGRMGKAEVLGLWVSVGHASKRTKFDSMSMKTMNCPDCKELARYIPKRMQTDLKMEQISQKTLIDKHIQITVHGKIFVGLNLKNTSGNLWNQIVIL